MLGRNIVTATLLVVGIIHLLPLVGVISSARLTSLYGLSFDEPNLAILMRHRAILFGILGLFLFYAAFRPSLQFLGFLAGFTSVVSFLWLVISAGHYNKHIAGVFFVDVIALVCLVIGAVAWFLQPAVADQSF